MGGFLGAKGYVCAVQAEGVLLNTIENGTPEGFWVTPIPDQIE